MSPRAVREYLDALRSRYGLAKKPKKTRLLDETQLAISPATIDRLLSPHRRRQVHRPLILNPATATLRTQVPLRTFGEWQHVRPGAVQADLVVRRDHRGLLPPHSHRRRRRHRPDRV